MFSFQLGDSAEAGDKEKYEQLFASLEDLLNCNQEWTLLLMDPLSNSFIMPLTDKLDDDPLLTSEDYERSEEENKQYGIDVLQAIDEENEQT